MEFLQHGNLFLHFINLGSLSCVSGIMIMIKELYTFHLKNIKRRWFVVPCVGT